MASSAHDLARWTRFAAKGGIGRCAATVDCVARDIGDLMFLKDDEIIVLMQLPEAGFYLGFCEGVVGRFSGTDVQFHGKLKRPIMAKRGSLAVAESRSISIERVSPSWSENLGGPRADSSSSIRVGSPAATLDSSTNSHPESLSMAVRRKPLSPDMHLSSSPPEPYEQSRGRAQELTASMSMSSVYSVASVSSPMSTMFFDAEDRRNSEDSSLSGEEVPSSGSRQASSSTKSAPTSSSSMDPMPKSPSKSTQAISSPPVSTSRSMERLLQSLSNLSPASRSKSGLSASPEFVSSASRDSSPPYGSLTSTPTSNSPSTSAMHGLTVAPLRFNKSPRLTANLASPPLSPSSPQSTSGPSSSQPTLDTASSLTSPRYLFPQRAPLPLPAAGNPPCSPLPLPPPAMPKSQPSPPSTASSAPESSSEGDESSLYLYDDRDHEHEHDDTTQLSTLNRHLRVTEDDEDGETDIGLSLLGALAMDEDEDEDGVVGTNGVDRRGLNAGVRVTGDILSDESEEYVATTESTPLPWTKYMPPVSASPTASHALHASSTSRSIQDSSVIQDNESQEIEVAKNNEEREEEEEEGYWDRASDIYDDYRYSHYSMASKRMSGMSVKSKSRMSILSSDKVPPIPNFSPGRLSFDTPSRPSVSSGRPSVSSTSSRSLPGRVNVPSHIAHASVSVYSRPSFESTSSADPGSPVALEPAPSNPVDGPEVRLRPPVARQVSADSENESARTPSMYSTRTLSPLSAQFPKMSTGIPSRLRMNSDAEVTVEDEDEGEVLGGKKMLPHAINPVSPLLYASFGANGRNSGQTEETERQSTSAYSESDEGHGFRKSHLRRSDVESMQSPTSPIDRSGMASALRTRAESEREPRVGLGMRAIVVDDDEDGHPVSMSGDVQADDSVERETSFTSSEAVTASTGHSPASLAPLPTVMPIPGALTPGVPSTVTPGAHPVSTPSPSSPGAPPALISGTQSTPDSGTTTSDQDTTTPSTLRPRQANQASHPFSRTSIFLPHPNAPKTAPGVAKLGPMYARPQQAGMSPNATPGAMPLVQPPPNATTFSSQVLRHIRGISLGPGGHRSPMTLYARCEPDLSQSPGPVPIVFSLDPLPPLPYMPPAIHQSATGSPHISSSLPTRAATVSSPARRSSTVPGALAPVRGSPPSRTYDTSPNTSADTSSTPALRLPRRSATAVASTQEPAANDSAPAVPISRPNFVPQVGATRPRSRSFSGFGEAVNTGTLPEQSREEPVSKVHSRSVTAASVSTPSPSQPTLSTPPTTNGLPASLRARHVPSPLSLHTGSRERSPTAVGPSTNTPSPNAGHLKSPTSPSFQKSPTIPSTMQLGLKPPSIGSSSASPTPLSPAMTSYSPVNFSDRERNASPASAMTGRTSVSTHPHDATSPQPWLNNVRHASLEIPRKNSLDGAPPRKSSDSTDEMPSPLPISESHLQSTRPSPLAHELPLRGKLSLPALRNKASMRSRLDDTMSVTSSLGNQESETVQVQDMDFELVKPSLPQMSLGRSSQDSSYTGHDADTSGTMQGDSMSMHSNAPRSPLFSSPMSSEAPPTESSVSIDAHRQREGKWMALLPVVPASQARKNKKVKRLLLEGVPSSVRYLVWCHLTNSKARAIPGIYAQLGRRPRVAAFADIEKDAKTYFPEQPQLHPCDGPLISLLQAYLSMVPDIQYSPGLTSIAGHLLLLSPEEDAFWIFTSMMDTHLRPYFSANTIQLEVDAELLSRAIDINDPSVGRKLYSSLSIPAGEVAKPLFSTLFVGILPVDYLHRIWDIFLYEGVTLLIRVGLALVHYVRRLLLQATSAEAAMEHLLHPPLESLPSTVDMFINQALSMKLKDEDIRKQRIKMESQLRRRIQTRMISTNGSSGMQTASISLPKAS